MQVTVISAMDVNCYLLQTQAGTVLVDSGFSFKRKDVAAQIAATGLQAGQLRLIFHTHGDGDHAGNSAWLKAKYGGLTALHPFEVESVKRGNLAYARDHIKPAQKFILNLVSPFAGIPTRDRFTPDLLLADGFSLAPYGIDGQCLFLPGHSAGSCGLLTADGSLFCGDLFVNWDRPMLNTNLDDPADARASLEKLRGLEIQTIFPGHGKPFPISALPEFAIS